ncbi:two-component regulator propeller domain-containing protein [Aquimarina sp. SS2-1]|uniref:hybrid sensor histidine kinase/response regulator transcription factor n=1 Tax=Aquimarina besae TaxID=3342247 RepID=UPI003670381E
MFSKKVVVYPLLFVALFIHAQNYKFHHYTLEDGLSQETINAIIKDSRGFLWLGTQDGLNRFDGDRFEIFKNEELQNSISGNHITKLLEDDLGNIWIGTGNNGVCVYDPSTKSIRRIHDTTIDMSAACSGIAKDNKGNVYISFFNQSLVKISRSDKSSLEINEIEFFTKISATISSLNIINNTLFVGTKEGNLFYSDLDRNGTNFKEYKHEHNWRNIKSIVRDTYGQVLIGTDSGLWKLNFQEKTSTQLKIKSDPSFTNLTIADIIVNADNIWAATDNGLYHLKDYKQDLLEFDTFKRYRGDNNLSNTISSSNVHCLYQDDEFLWIGANKLDVLEFNPPVFRTLQNSDVGCSKKPFVNNHIYSILKEKKRTWVGTRGGMNLITNDSTYNFRKTDKPNSIAYDVVRGIERDIDNNLWIATTKGVSILNLKKFSPDGPNFTPLLHNPVDDSSLSENNTRSIFVDRDHNIWITTFGGGINLFTGDVKAEKFSFKHFKNIPGYDNSISSDLVLTMIQDHQKNYWIATKNGLNRLNFEDDNFEKPSFKTFRNIPGDTTSLSNNSVLSVFEDSDHVLWVGTQNGLHKFDASKETFKVYGKKEGLLNPVVYNILEDENKNLWMSTNFGLFRFNKKTEIFSNFNSGDGLLSTEFNLGAAFKDPKTNELYFGGIDGLNFFKPEKVSDLDREGAILLTELRIKNNIEVPSANDTSVLKKNIITTKSIQLKHDQFPFYLSFSNMDFRAFKNNKYLYKLNPVDDTWNDLSNTQEIQFPSLSPGTYKLQIQGKTRNQIWDKDPLELEIEILPPWWKTNIMYTVYILIIVFILFTIHRFLLARKLNIQEAQKLREIDEQKSKLYTNITHEFRTPLTVILGINNTLKERLASNKCSQYLEHCEMIRRNGKNMLQLVNQMLDLAKLEEGKLKLHLQQGNIAEFCRYIVSSYSSLAESKNISIAFYTEQENIRMDFDQDKIQQILSNLLTNAIKFSDLGSDIVVHLHQENDDFILKVKDSGKGIPKEKITQIFDRFYQVEHVDKKEQAGTGIGLSLTKELVTLMDGNIEVDSTLHQGSIFTVIIPITNTAKVTAEFSMNKKPSPKTKTYPQETAQNIKSKNDRPLVLVVDDNKDIIQLLSVSLTDSYNVVAASNGNEGMEKATQLIPDIIICDVMMPEKDGLELCDILKKDERTSHIPIILLTAKVTENDKIAGLLHGADAYLHKPFSKTELLVRIEKLISLRTILQQKFSLNSSWQTVSDKKMNTKNKDFIDKVLTSIEKNLDNTNYGKLELSEDLHLSESQAYRKIKAITGFSTAIFIRKVRLQKAKFLLQTTDHNVSEVSYMTGFSNPSWFCKAFKEEYDQPPNAMRNSLVSN